MVVALFFCCFRHCIKPVVLIKVEMFVTANLSRFVINLKIRAHVNSCFDVPTEGIQ